MRFHSNTLTDSEFYAAAREAGVAFGKFEQRGSRKRARAFEVILTGSSSRNSSSNDFKAATWDEWGLFFAALYKRDNEMFCSAYVDVDHFNWSTTYRFSDCEMPEDTHAMHNWQFVGASATGNYSVYGCSKCSAEMRRATSHADYLAFIA